MWTRREAFSVDPHKNVRGVPSINAWCFEKAQKEKEKRKRETTLQFNY